jgi:hypothetical protein
MISSLIAGRRSGARQVCDRTLMEHLRTRYRSVARAALLFESSGFC